MRRVVFPGDTEERGPQYHLFDVVLFLFFGRNWCKDNVSPFVFVAYPDENLNTVSTRKV